MANFHPEPDPEGESLDSRGQPSDEIFTLLTDALKGGPGSAAWAEALSRLSVSQEMDEYAALLTARQRIEAGKAFRRIEAGPALTEAVLAGVAAQADAEERPRFRMRQPRARTIAALAAAAALIVFSVAAIVAEVMLYGGDPHVQISMPRYQRSGNYQNFEAAVPIGWHPIGPLRVRADHGLHLASGIKQVTQSGGLLREAPLPASHPFEIDADIRYQGGSSTVPELFVTDDPNVDDDHPTDSSHEFVWTMRNDSPTVSLPDHSLQTDSAIIAFGEQHTLAVKIKINGVNAIVEATNSKKYCSRWSGPNLLDVSKPWRLGVRFVVLGNKHADCVSLQNVRIFSPGEPGEPAHAGRITHAN